MTTLHGAAVKFVEGSFDVCELSTPSPVVFNSRPWLCASAVLLESQKRGDMRHPRLVAFANRPNVAAADASVVLHERALAAFMKMLWSVLAARGTGRSDTNAAGWRFGHEDLLTALGEEPGLKEGCPTLRPACCAVNQVRAQRSRSLVHRSMWMIRSSP